MRGARILLVEDDAVLRDLLTRNLGVRGHHEKQYMYGYKGQSTYYLYWRVNGIVALVAGF